VTASESVASVFEGVRQWSPRRWVATVVATTAIALATGIPTGIVKSPYYTRMSPVLWWNYPVWAVSAVMAGMIAATYVRTPLHEPNGGRTGVAGGVLSFLAVGCPVCNKVVVWAIGVSGALTIWAPLQPLLAVLSFVLLGWALVQRLRGERRCPVASGRSSV
jgi:hypothetical protein